MSDGWIKTDRGWRKSYGPPAEHVAPGNYPCPRVITDTMPLTEHIDGRQYDSKSEFRKVTKANGCIEVGNEKINHGGPKHDSSKLYSDLRRNIAQVMS